MSDDVETLVDGRLADLNARIEDARASIALWLKERDELLGWKAVSARFKGRGAIEPEIETLAPPVDADALAAESSRRRKRPSSKPESAPSLADMVIEVLRDNQDGLAPKEITQYIQAKWWPTAPADSVRSTVWNLWKSGSIKKSDHVYLIYGKNRPQSASDARQDEGHKPTETAETSLSEASAYFDPFS